MLRAVAEQDGLAYLHRRGDVAFDAPVVRLVSLLIDEVVLALPADEEVGLRLPRLERSADLSPVARAIGLEPAAELRPEPFLLGRELEVHGQGFQRGIIEA